MSTAIFPTLAGIGYPIPRVPIWDNVIQTATSGKETRLAYQSYPRYEWTIDVNVLRQAGASSELATLLGFFNTHTANFDTWLYKDPDDYIVSSQTIATGTGSSTSFQLQKTFGGFTEPVLAPDTSSTINVYLNGSSQAASSYTVNGWSSTTPGTLVFNSAPTSSQAITADFQYYYPCRFNVDKIAFNLKYSHIYDVKRLPFISVKN